MKGQALNNRRRFLLTCLLSRHHTFVPILIALFLSWTANDGSFVAACQLCVRNLVTTNIPISFGHSHALEAFTTENDRYFESKTALTPKKNVEHSGPRIPFLPRQRRTHQPLFMMFNNDHNNETSSSSTSDIAGIENLENSNNQSDFDSVAFFDDLQRSGDATTRMGANDDNQVEENAMSAVMLGVIGFYKKIISPLLPPACRFVPTCSTYGVQAIKEFGSTKGMILIAWRILRCTPIGGKGYDPPKWPPVYYTFSSY